MDVGLLLLRVVHIGAGVFWVGGAFTFFLFVAPSAGALEPPATKRFMDEVVNNRRFPTAILIASTLTILAGALLYWRDSAGLSAAWITSPTGIGFTVGAVAAIVSWILGPLAIRPTITRLQELGDQVMEAHRPPTAEEAGTLAALNQRLRTVGIINLVLLGIAVLSMAVARYL
ncbi:MAG: hypothetical protein H0X16_12015 [Chloroflexi bacterium]|nr:hypothetical protein [Chloroflexota bacterium]